MKIKQISAWVLAALLPVTLLTSCQTTPDSPVEPITPFSFKGWADGSVEFPVGGGLESMKKVAADGRLEMYLDMTSLELAIRDVQADKVWYSSPMSDPTFSGTAEDATRALLQIQVNNAGTVKPYNSFSHCVKTGRYAVESRQDGVRIQMTIGQNKVITALDLPQAVEKERFETEILAKLEGAAKAELEKRYTLYSANDTSMSERKLTAALEKFPVLAERDLYILNTGVPDFAAQTVKTALDSIGYDEEKIQQDNTDNGADVQVEAAVRFDLELELWLEDNQLLTQVDCSRLTESAGAQVTDIAVLEWFGGSYAPEDEGWLLLPDGSGALQNINGETATYPSYSVRIYGEEKALRKEQQYARTEQAVLPVFGQKQNDTGYIAYIEQGDALASVSTHLKGTLPVSSIYTSFTVAEAALIDAGFSNSVNTANVPMVQPAPYREKLKIRYAFLSGAQADLYGMSQQVRSWQQAAGRLPTEKPATGELPLNIEILGSADKEASLLGLFPVRRQQAATTFSQAGEIVQALHDRGVGPIQLQYAGWCNGGLYTTHLQKIAVERVLGGKDGFLKLKADLEQQGDALYPQAAMLSVSNTKGLDTRKLAARALGNNLTTLYAYDIATGNRFDYRIGTYIAPASIPAYGTRLLEGLNKLGITHIAATDIGRDLYADMNKTAGVNRVESQKLVEETLGKFSGQELMIAGGNAYTWTTAAYLADVPMDSSRYNREMYAVPFVQMVVHGWKPYSAAAVNAGDDYREQILRAVAFDADVQFRFSYASSDFWNDTYFVNNLSTDYREWLDIAESYYARASKDRARIGGADMVAYRRLQPEVFETVYANGVSVIANYGTAAVTVDGQTIAGQDWLCREGDAQ